MKKIFLLLIIIVGVSAVWVYIVNAPEAVDLDSKPSADHKNTTYSIDGQFVTLVDGYDESAVEGDTATKVTTRYFGNEIVTDLDGDGTDDIAFIVTQDSGGSGVFYYAVGAVWTPDGYKGTDGYLLGDRVAPQSTDVSPNPRHKNVIVFNYQDRTLNEPMTTAPSIGKSAYLKLVPESMQWAIVEPDFEGESN